MLMINRLILNGDIVYSHVDVPRTKCLNFQAGGELPNNRSKYQLSVKFFYRDN